MTRQEKLVLLIVALLMVTRFGAFARDAVVAAQYGVGGIPPHDEQMWRAISIAWSGLVNVGAAFWLYTEARLESLKSWIWALLGLCFGLLGVALFYLIQLYAAREPNNSFKPKPLRGSA